MTAERLAAAPTTYLDKPLEAQRGEICGIPAYWVPSDGLTTAGLVFRVGRSDEPLALGGISHIIEHLALFALGQQPHYFNGAVEPGLTSFIVRGTPEEVSRFFSRVGAALHSLPFDRLSYERRIIATEGDGSSALLPNLMRLRHGAHGIGTLGYPQYALQNAGNEEIEAWVARNFTRGNAVMWISGPFPRNMSLQLPDGPRMWQPTVTPPPNNLPAYVSSPYTNVVGQSVLLDRSMSAAAADYVLQKRGMKYLRYDGGISYTVSTDVQRLSSSQSELFFLADCSPDQATEALKLMTVLFDSVARNGPTAEELDDFREEVAKGYFDPQAGSSLAQHHAIALLNNGEESSWQKTYTELQGVTVESVGSLLHTGLSSRLTFAPAGTTIPELEEMRIFDTVRVPLEDGDVIRGIRQVDEEKVQRTLTVSPEGIMLSTPHWYTVVRWADCVGVLCDEVGGRELIGRDGDHIYVAPHMWKKGLSITRLIDENVDSTKRIERDVPEHTQAQRATKPKPRFTLWNYVMMALILAIVGLGIAANNMGEEEAIPPPTTVASARYQSGSYTTSYVPPSTSSQDNDDDDGIPLRGYVVGFAFVAALLRSAFGRR